MTRLRSVLLLSIGFLAAACDSNNSPIATASQLENDASAALLRRVFADCPHKTDAKVASIVLGPTQVEASTAFRQKLSDLGPRLLTHKEITATRLADVTRILEKTPGPDGNRNLVLLLQVIELTPDGPNFNAKAAWAYKDDLAKQEYRLVSKTDGTFEITPGTVLERKP
jgi:hypothetical protein